MNAFRVWPRWACVGLVALSLMATAGAVHAQGGDDSKRDDARRYFRTGQAAFDDGQYLVAARAFEESYRILPLPEIAFSMAQAYRLQYFVDKQPASLERAIAMYRTYVDKKPGGNRLGVAITHLAELEPIWLRMKAAGTKTEGPQSKATLVTINSPTVQEATAVFKGETHKLPWTLELEPGNYEVEVTAEGYFAKKYSFQAVAGRLMPLEVALEPRPAQVSVKTKSGASITLDGRPQGDAPLLRPLAVPEGEHFVAVTKRGHRPWSQQVALTRGQELTLEPKLRITKQRKWAYVIAGIGGLAGLTGTSLALSAAREDRKARQHSNTIANGGSITVAQLAEYNTALKERNNQVIGSVSMFAFTGALLFTGGLLYYLDTPRAERPPEAPRRPAAKEPPPSILSVVPTAGPGMAGMSMSGRF